MAVGNLLLVSRSPVMVHRIMETDEDIQWCGLYGGIRGPIYAPLGAITCAVEVDCAHCGDGLCAGCDERYFYLPDWRTDQPDEQQHEYLCEACAGITIFDYVGWLYGDNREEHACQQILDGRGVLLSSSLDVTVADLRDKYVLTMMSKRQAMQDRLPKWLTEVAYLCYTCLLESIRDDLRHLPSGRRSTVELQKQTSRRYGISRNNLKRINTLSSAWGGIHARKASGIDNPLAREDSDWLTEQVDRMIQARVDYVRSLIPAREVTNGSDGLEVQD